MSERFVEKRLIWRGSVSDLVTDLRGAMDAEAFEKLRDQLRPSHSCLDCESQNASRTSAEPLALCQEHLDERLNNTHKSSFRGGGETERARILSMLRERAADEFLAGREDGARKLRDLMAAITK